MGSKRNAGRKVAQFCRAQIFLFETVFLRSKLQRLRRLNGELKALIRKNQSRENFTSLDSAAIFGFCEMRNLIIISIHVRFM